ncbi:protein lunapark [Pochonia chlamydosporia 170]|uniref:Endoplasmic reticulum junction formation protein lunapark n=1 Tax=Pochonia chlamydosporia 170 TaxID=1380566 RepID=A0A179F182_METCM|nr:protein lunapark [Pochonia chlamydosporia 170]OAQ58833.1 protein lunapark [Pochonia chlamydosporia 170]
MPTWTSSLPSTVASAPSHEGYPDPSRRKIKFKGDDSSPASFEKTLSALSSKITTSQAHLDRLHTNSRRVKVLWTLYLGFAYLVYAIVLLLVVGYRNLGAYEWTGMAGGPILIYATRTLITTYFTFRIDSLTTRLKAHQQERANTIQKLKDATKYDSTMELIEKYGGENKPKPKKNEPKEDSPKDAKKHPQPQPGRTNLPPPPTANIVRPEAQQQQQKQEQQNAEVGAEFAPNAFTHPPPPPPRTNNQYMTPETHWYDRIFDVLLGEDETAAKNRFALICDSCRLVNGQAPPGTKSLGEVGMWRCMGCGATNGEVDEGKRIIEEVLAKSGEEDPIEEVDEEEPDEVATGTGTGTDSPADSVKARRRNKT